MKIDFKTKRIREEWNKLLEINPQLVFIVLFVADKLGAITITGIFRTQLEQYAIYGDNYKQKSVHQLWRGVDIRIPAQYDKDRIEYLIDMINQAFPYGKRDIKTIIRHEVKRDGLSFGDHLHVQTI